jgi:hypothetical protein
LLEGLEFTRQDFGGEVTHFLSFENAINFDKVSYFRADVQFGGAYCFGETHDPEKLLKSSVDALYSVIIERTFFYLKRYGSIFCDLTRKLISIGYFTNV